MSPLISKEWGAIRGDRVILTRDTEDALRSALRKQGLDPSTYEIAALPKPHTTILVDETQAHTGR